MNRGEIWWVSLPEPQGSEPGWRRPVVLVSADEFNQSRIKTVLAVVLTSNLELAKAPGNVLLSRRETGLVKDCVANVSQVITVDKKNLTDFAGSVPVKIMDQIDLGLRLVLNL